MATIGIPRLRQEKLTVDLPKTGDLRACISRHFWAVDRLGRLVAGGGILLCLAASFLFEAALPFLLLAALIGFQLLITALLGWCPMQCLMWRLGVKEREEIFAEFYGQGPRVLGTAGHDRQESPVS